MAKSRQSNFELLRILSMFFITLGHYAVHPDWQLGTGFAANTFVIQLLSSSGKICVNIFVILSAYFLVDSTFKWEKVKHLCLQVFFYSAGILAIVLIFNLKTVTPYNVLRNLLPLTFNMYWFATSYIVFYILSPYLRKLLATLDKKSFRQLVIILTIVLSIIPTITFKGYLSSNLAWFIYLYIVTAYYKKYKHEMRFLKHSLQIFVVSVLLLAISIAALDYLAVIYPPAVGFETYLATQYSFLGLVIAFSAFDVFRKLNIGVKPIINRVASCMFGIYLFHDNYYMREILADSVDTTALIHSIPHILTTGLIRVGVIFVVGILIELARQKLFSFIQAQISSE